MDFIMNFLGTHDCVLTDFLHKALFVGFALSILGFYFYQENT